MSYEPENPTAPLTIKGNLKSTAASVQDVALIPNLAFSGTALKQVPVLGRQTTGNTTLLLTDVGTSMVSTDSLNVTYTLPVGFPSGYRVRSYQGGAGQINYAGTGVTIINNGVPYSAGGYANGYYVDIQNIGNDTWVLTGNIVNGILKWSIYGQANVNQGDALSYAIVYPAIVNNYPSGVTINIAGTNVSAAGFSQTLVQAIQSAVTLNPTTLSFDGTSVLTVLPGAPNPICFNFFAVPNYTTGTNETVVMTISAASQGTISQATATTVVHNVSKPTNPAALFPTTTLTTVGTANSGQANVTVTSAAGLVILGTVTGTSIPAQTWITAINGNVITLSANLTGTISTSASLTYTPPGFWLDFSTSSYITKNGSNQVSQATDLINGYTVNQATGANKPVWNATALNSLGGLTFNGSGWMTSTTPPIINILDPAAQPYTILMVAQLSSSSATGFYMGWDALNLQSNHAANLAMVGNTAAAEDMTQGLALNVPYTWMYVCDGNAQQAKFNGLRQAYQVTLASDAASGITTLTAVDATGVQANMLVNCGVAGLTAQDAIRVVSVVGNVITLTNPTLALIPAGTVLTFYSRVILNNGGYPLPASTSTQYVLGSSQGAMTSQYLTKIGISPSGTTATNGLDGTLYEVIVVPRMLTLQEWRGVTLYLANKWGVATTQNTSGSTAAGASSIVMSSVAGLYDGQLISTVTGIAANTVILSVNTSTKTIHIDTPTTAIISTGTTLTFNGPCFKQPQLLDITQFYPTFRDDFTALNLGNNTGWKDYLGSYAYPADTYNGAYSATGHGSCDNGGFVGAVTSVVGATVAGAIQITLASTSNINPGCPIQVTSGISSGTAVASVVSGTVITLNQPVAAPGLTNGQSLTFFINYSFESEWYLDAINYPLWQKYTPFNINNPADAVVGNLTITASPAPAAIANSIGYAPPNPYADYTSGILVGGNQFTQQYGYWEGRIKCPRNIGAWPALWLLAANGTWPPEIDIFEGNGAAPAGGAGGLGTAGSNFYSGAPTYVSTSQSPYGDMLVDTTAQYALFGVEVTPTKTSFYINRELAWVAQSSYDYNTPFYVLANLAVNGKSSGVQPDNTTPQLMQIDYIAAWKRNLQTPSIPGGTQAETTALLAAMLVQPSAPTVTLINTLIASLKSYTTSFGQTLWAALDFLYVLSAETAQQARINWKNPSQIGTEVGTPLFTANKGYAGTQYASYIDTGVNLSTAGFQLTATNSSLGFASATLTGTGNAITTFPTDSTGNLSHFAMYARSNAGIAPRLLCGGATGGGAIWIAGLPSTSKGYFVASRNNYQATGMYDGNYFALGFFPGTPNTSTVALDNSNIALADGPDLVCLVHGGVYLSPDDTAYLYSLFYAYLHAMGAL